MVDHDELLDRLTRLKPTTIRDQLGSLLDEAARRELTLREAVAFLCAREIAHFPTVRDLGSFDFNAQPSADPGQISDLAACRWIAHGDTVLLLGPPDVGMTHLRIALGCEAIRAGYSVLFVAATAPVAALAKARADGRLKERLAFLAKPKLPVIDELGCLPFEPNAGHLFLPARLPPLRVF